MRRRVEVGVQTQDHMLFVALGSNGHLMKCDFSQLKQRCSWRREGYATIATMVWVLHLWATMVGDDVQGQSYSWTMGGHGPPRFFFFFFYHICLHEILVSGPRKFFLAPQHDP